MSDKTYLESIHELEHTVSVLEDALDFERKHSAELEALTPWVSVEDRLPDELQEVLSFSNDDGLFQSIYRAGSFKKSLVVWEHVGVNYWMPLPAPPKEKGDE